MTLNYNLSDFISELFVLGMKLYCVNKCKLGRHWGCWSHSRFWL